MIPLLDVKNLSISLSGETICEDISFSIHRNEAVGLIGKSGAGKSILVQSLLRLNNAKVVSGQALFENEDLFKKSKQAMQKIYLSGISIVFQSALSALNPTIKVGLQIVEAFNKQNLSFKEAKQKTLSLMKEVGISFHEKRFSQYPHQLSGGICQRICIAIALAQKPKLLILDEPTTSLDVTTQLQVLDLIQKICHKHKIALLLITHDLGIISKMCDNVLVMKEGKIVEKGSVEKVLLFPVHPATKELVKTSLINILPKRRVSTEKKEPLLTISGLSKTFFIKNHRISAVNNINLNIIKKRTLALIGESGSGKSTLAHLLVKLLKPSSGSISFNQIPLLNYPEKILREEIQIIFQNPYSSLNPFLTVRQSLKEPLSIHKKAYDNSVLAKLLKEVKLPERFLDRYPHELSGGERQRVCIARALSLKPKLLILDEPTSALDVFLQSKILLLLQEIQEKYDLTYLFITHNLFLIKDFADDIAIMYLGKIIEKGSCENIFSEAKHPYTKALLSAVLSPNPLIEKKKNITPIQGENESINTQTKGCSFYPCCPKATGLCEKEAPFAIGKEEHIVFCHLPEKAPLKEEKEPAKTLIN